MANSSPMANSNLEKNSESADNSPEQNLERDKQFFYEACSSGNEATVFSMLNGDINFPHWKGGLPIACQQGHAIVVRHILNTMDNELDTLLTRVISKQASASNRRILTSRDYEDLKSEYQTVRYDALNEAIRAGQPSVVELLLNYGAAADKTRLADALKLSEQYLTKEEPRQCVNRLLKGIEHRPDVAVGRRFLHYCRGLQVRFEKGWGQKSREKAALMKQVLDRLEEEGFEGRTRREIAKQRVKIGEKYWSILDICKMHRYSRQTKDPDSYTKILRITDPVIMMSEAQLFLAREALRVGKKETTPDKAKKINEIRDALPNAKLNKLEDLCTLKTDKHPMNLLQTMRFHRDKSDRATKKTASYLNFCEYFDLEHHLTPAEINELGPATQNGLA